MPAFPSDEWVDAFCEAVSAHPDAARTADTLAGVYRFVVDDVAPDGWSRCAWIGREDGVVAARRVPDPGDGTRLEMATTLARWKALLTGEMSIRSAILFRRLRLSGDVAGVTRDLSAASPLLESLSEVPTTWPDEDVDRHADR